GKESGRCRSSRRLGSVSHYCYVYQYQQFLRTTPSNWSSAKQEACSLLLGIALLPAHRSASGFGARGKPPLEATVATRMPTPAKVQCISTLSARPGSTSSAKQQKALPESIPCMWSRGPRRSCLATRSIPHSLAL